MKYKALLFGNNKAIIDDFFAHITSDFELQNCSSRFDDIISHLKYYDPDVIVYCMNNETRDMMMRMSGLRRDRIKRDTVVVVIGNEASCGELRRINIEIADLEIIKPNNAVDIQNQVIGFLNERMAQRLQAKKEAEEAERARQEEAQKLLDHLANELEVEDTSVRRHILVVDDDPRMLKVIKRHLQDDYDVATAVNGKVALKFLESKSTDLILLDYEMPVQNGPQILAELRDNPATTKIPVIFLTGINDREKIRTALSLKPQGYLLKPIERDKLLESISNILK